jgi:hypothetical protein
MCKCWRAHAIAVFYVLCSSVSESEATRQQRVAEAEAYAFKQIREEVNNLEPLHLIGAWTDIATDQGRKRSPFEVCCVLIRVAELDTRALDVALREPFGADTMLS